MQERSGKRVGIDLQVNKYACNRKGMDDVQDTVLTLLVPVRLKCENKLFPEQRIIFLDLFVFEVCRVCISVIGIEDVVKALFVFLRDLGDYRIVFKGS